jgi:hypothetical protein
LNISYEEDLKQIQNAIENMKPDPITTYNRKCYHSGSNGTIVVTKTLNQHILFDTNMYQSMGMEYKLGDIPLYINIHGYK